MTITSGNISGGTGLSIDILLRGEVNLASPPEIFLRISEIIDNPAKTSRDAEEVIKHDPGLAARLLRIVNSAFYGFPGQITSISRAITIIGVKELRDLVLATVVVERFGHLPNKLMTMREFWRISVRAALLASEMENSVSASSPLESVFICGLLHEIGRLVIYAKIPELARAAILLAAEGQMEESEAERKTYGFDHYQLAAELARRWHLHEVIVTTLKHHECPEKAENYSWETALVTMACRMSLADVKTPQQLASVLPGLTRRLEFLSLEPGLLPGIVAAADKKFEEIFKMLFQG